MTGGGINPETWEEFAHFPATNTCAVLLSSLSILSVLFSQFVLSLFLFLHNAAASVLIYCTVLFRVLKRTGPAEAV